MPKYNGEGLIEEAWEWWNNLNSQENPYAQENIILREYMKFRKIKKNNVDW